MSEEKAIFSRHLAFGLGANVYGDAFGDWLLSLANAFGKRSFPTSICSANVPVMPTESLSFADFAARCGSALTPSRTRAENSGEGVIFVIFHFVIFRAAAAVMAIANIGTFRGADA